MIHAEIHRNGELLMKRTFRDDGELTLQTVAERLAQYIEDERLNELGECQLRVRRAKVAAKQNKNEDLLAS